MSGQDTLSAHEHSSPLAQQAGYLVNVRSLLYQRPPWHLKSKTLRPARPHQIWASGLFRKL